MTQKKTRCFFCETILGTTHMKICGQVMCLRCGGKATGIVARQDDLLVRAAKTLSEMDHGLLDGSLLDDGVLEYLCDNVRPLVCDLAMHSPRCTNTDDCAEKLEAT